MYSQAFNDQKEERYQLCTVLQAKNKNNKQMIFAQPSHIKGLFGGFLETPLYTEIATLRGGSIENSSVSSITIYKNKLYFGSYDSTIRIWNIETHEEIATLEGHTDFVLCLAFHKNKLFSGSFDETIRIWNTDTYDILTAHV